MRMQAFPGRVAGTVTAPVSKSYAQRALAIALLADGVTRLQGMGLCNDIEAAVSVVQKLGAEVYAEEAAYTVKGGVIRLKDAQLHIGESGLATRLFTPVAALSPEEITITGHGSILERPIGMMKEPLRKVGVKVSSNGSFLPITVQGPIQGGEIHIDGSVSSQFLTGLLIALPLARQDSLIVVDNLTSRPYVDMTLEIIRDFGVEIENENYHYFRIRGNQKYLPGSYRIEGDWSGASCMLVAGAIAGEITLKGLRPDSLQADIQILEALRMAGADVQTDQSGDVTVRRNRLDGFRFDATDCPDLFPALAVLAANCRGESLLVGTRRLKHKESDRTTAIKELLVKAGATVDVSAENYMKIKGGPIHGNAIVDSFNDHRIAMAAGVLALNAQGPLTVERAEAVGKSYPRFWNDLEAVRL